MTPDPSRPIPHAVQDPSLAAPYPPVGEGNGSKGLVLIMPGSPRREHYNDRTTRSNAFGQRASGDTGQEGDAAGHSQHVVCVACK